MLFVNLDHFKSINDTLGHAVGDELLQEAARRITLCIRDYDVVARFGGDEFAVIMPQLTNQFYVAFVARRIIEELSKPFTLSIDVVHLSASIGISVFPHDASSPGQLLKNATIAVNHAKKDGRSTLMFFEKDMHAKAMQRVNLEKALKQALENDEFVVYYQPKIDPTSNQVIGMEALLRWQRPGFGLVSPAVFIPIAEQTGLIVPIGAHVLNVACRQNKAWIDAGRPPMCVSVNLSTRQFQQGDALLTTIKTTLANTGLAAEFLEMEITESMMMLDMSKAIDLMDEVQALGVKISVDDFGTGYSSLSALKLLPIQTLKIDRSFIIGLVADQDSIAIVSAIISLAKQLHLKIVAEGVETIEQVKFLQENGCDEIQGFFYAKPMPAQEFEAFLDNNQLITIHS